ncbi:putative disease resistance protein [Hibiscus syriacus]|uniref:Disease resistance protein n=1 Tax=Hibiscus syriacus TaxID=106335 RepID=A0A6A3B1U7_HIBSY|nr:putative disease resistance protein [Hibiscus syriacus]
MPAKTVVFTNVRKFDGDKFRWISSGEYIQMSGRAGRRGIDARGICILMVDERMEPSTAKMMLKGNADSLNSIVRQAPTGENFVKDADAFHLSYNMLLNQLRCEDSDPESMLRNSFYQFQADRAIPDLEKQVKALEEERESMIIEEEDSLKNYYNLIQQYKSLKNDIREIVFSPKYCLPYMKSGRPVCIQLIDDETSPSFSIEDHVTWGVLMDFHRVKSIIEADDANKRPEDASYALDILTRCNVSKDGVGKKTIKIVPLKEPGEPLVVSVPLSQVTSLSSARLTIPKDLLPMEARENALKKLSEFISRYPNGMPLDTDDNIHSNSYKKAVRRLEALESLFEKHEIAKSPLIEQKLKLLNRKEELTSKIRSIKKKMRSSTVLAFKDELKARKRVLRRLGYITSDDVVELKGKVACEISSADELILTELMFSGVLKDIKPEEMVSLLSCFVWQEKLQDAAKPREELELLFTQLQDTARKMAKVQHECKAVFQIFAHYVGGPVGLVQIDVESFVSPFRPDIMEAVYAWAKGSKFYEIMEITQVFEGSLIRAIRRLEEVLQQLILAAKSIGETELETKFEMAVSKIKRDIVFAASLYL